MKVCGFWFIRDSTMSISVEANKSKYRKLIIDKCLIVKIEAKQLPRQFSFLILITLQANLFQSSSSIRSIVENPPCPIFWEIYVF